MSEIGAVVVISLSGGINISCSIIKSAVTLQRGVNDIVCRNGFRFNPQHQIFRRNGFNIIESINDAIMGLRIAHTALSLMM